MIQTAERSIALGCLLLYLSLNDSCQFFAENLSFIIIDQVETVSVIGCAQIVRDAVGDIVFFQICRPLIFFMAYLAELNYS